MALHYLTARRFMNIPILTWAKASGAAAISSTRAVKCAAFCSPRPTIGSTSSILTVCAWMQIDIRIDWQGDPARGVNGDTLDFLKNMNAGLKARHPSALLIAEDSTAFPGVTRPVSEGGLGFDYKWDLGWMHDTLTYMQTPPDERAERRGQLLFSMEYFPNEHYLLPLSHDEVVHGKAAIVQKMWGADLTDKYAQARAFYLYMFAHPGKKLNFMGNELGLRVEWSEAAELDWTYIDGPFHTFFCALGKAYCEHPALHADYLPDSFRWLPENLDAPCVFAWGAPQLRRASDRSLQLL